MGTLIYGSPGVVIDLDDRVLAHLRVVLLAKLRREEKFTMSWDDVATGKSHTIWLHPAIPLHFELDTMSGVPLNRAWVDQLTSLANSGSGLRIVPEPEPEPA